MLPADFAVTISRLRRSERPFTPCMFTGCRLLTAHKPMLSAPCMGVREPTQKRAQFGFHLLAKAQRCDVVKERGLLSLRRGNSF